MKDVSIIIVNYNTHAFVKSCIESIYLQEKHLSFEIIVVDNNSSEKGIKELPDMFPEAVFIYLNDNKGFGSGCNSGAKKATGEYLLFLNPDTEDYNASVQILLDYSISNTDVGCVTGLLQNKEGHLQYCYNKFPDFNWEAKEAFGIGVGKTISKLMSRQEIKDDVPFRVDWAHGACLMMRQRLFEEIGGFDERIFLYYEDVDLQKRLNDAGYCIYCIPSARFFHHERSSVRSENSMRVYFYNMHFYKIYYFTKHRGPLFVFMLRLLFISGYITKTMLLPFRKKYKNARISTLKNYFLVMKIYLTVWKI